MIPKKIHMTYKDETIPKGYEKNVAEWKKLCPDWDLCYYSNSAVFKFFETYFPEFQNDLKKVTSGVVLADLFRYAVIYIFGGLYTDMDTLPLKPIPKEWLFFKAVVGHEYQPSKYTLPFREETNDDTLCQWTFFSIPKHPLFFDALHLSFENLRTKKFHLTSVSDVLEASGPICFTKAASPYLHSSDTLLLDMEVFGSHHILLPKTERSVIEHQFDGRFGWVAEISAASKNVSFN